MDPSTAIGWLVAIGGAISTVAGSVGILFFSISKWIKRLESRDDEQQKQITNLKEKESVSFARADAAEKVANEAKAHAKEVDEKVASLADMCPITEKPCPLRRLFKNGLKS